MAHFAACPHETYNWGRLSGSNAPVNLDAFTSFEKGQRRSYMDSDGKPAIHFHTVDKRQAETWVFTNAEQRDEAFAFLLERGRP